MCVCSELCFALYSNAHYSQFHVSFDIPKLFNQSAQTIKRQKRGTGREKLFSLRLDAELLQWHQQKIQQGDIHSCRRNNNGILNEQRRQWAMSCVQAKAAKKSKSIIQFSIYISFDYHSVAAILIASFHDLFSANIIVSRISLSIFFAFKNRVWHFSRLHFFLLKKVLIAISVALLSLGRDWQ